MSDNTNNFAKGSINRSKKKSSKKIKQAKATELEFKQNSQDYKNLIGPLSKKQLKTVENIAKLRTDYKVSPDVPDQYINEENLRTENKRKALENQFFYRNLSSKIVFPLVENPFLKKLPFDVSNSTPFLGGDERDRIKALKDLQKEFIPPTDYLRPDNPSIYNPEKETYENIIQAPNEYNKSKNKLNSRLKINVDDSGNLTLEEPQLPSGILDFVKQHDNSKQNDIKYWEKLYNDGKISENGYKKIQQEITDDTYGKPGSLKLLWNMALGNYNYNYITEAFKLGTIGHLFKAGNILYNSLSGNKLPEIHYENDTDNFWLKYAIPSTISGGLAILTGGAPKLFKTISLFSSSISGESSKFSIEKSGFNFGVNLLTRGFTKNSKTFEKFLYRSGGSFIKRLYGADFEFKSDESQYGDWNKVLPDATYKYIDPNSIKFWNKGQINSVPFKLDPTLENSLKMHNPGLKLNMDFLKNENLDNPFKIYNPQDVLKSKPIKIKDDKQYFSPYKPSSYNLNSNNTSPITAMNISPYSTGSVNMPTQFSSNNQKAGNSGDSYGVTAGNVGMTPFGNINIQVMASNGINVDIESTHPRVIVNGYS